MREILDVRAFLMLNDASPMSYLHQHRHHPHARGSRTSPQFELSTASSTHLCMDGWRIMLLIDGCMPARSICGDDDPERQDVECAATGMPSMLA
ncbi:uncharacterized protein H6S33_002019 [Morchella sextelata]|uniref:uncharacterized protein n=1 Tax=Morchella sextelata TaxID=1174677 RepID=UPI001D056101|nr:uncharacterized protein H6S33_002019 [Morchella sextelata]KAH0607967.1 hypothetical protein H6S33_002019 [Morchella sextelata]